MNKSRQQDIRAFCNATFMKGAIQRFGTLRRYKRFVRRFFNQHKRYPDPTVFPKRHGKNERKGKPVRVKGAQ